MKKTIKKATTWIMVVCMIISFVPVFGSAAAAEEKQIQSFEQTGSQAAVAAVISAADEPNAPGDFTELPSEGGSKGWNSENVFGFLWDLLKAIGENLRALSVNEVLNLPANAMDDVVTYIFSVFQLLGINMDSVYKMLSSIFFFL